jgi:hypothetical protein
MESVCSKMDKQATGVNANTVERAKSLFSGSLLRLNEIDGPYFYEVSGTNNIPGSLSFLLGVAEAQAYRGTSYCQSTSSVDSTVLREVAFPTTSSELFSRHLMFRPTFFDTRTGKPVCASFT